MAAQEVLKGVVSFQSDIEARAQRHAQRVEEIECLRHAFQHARKNEGTPEKEQTRRRVCFAIEAG